MLLGSKALEVAIGLVFVFLVVSLVLTAVREAIESYFKSRAIDLERALAELLADPGGTGLRTTFYNHPLIAALYPGAYEPERFPVIGASRGAEAWKPRWVIWLFWSLLLQQARGARRKPTYIPRTHFATAILDLARAGTLDDLAAGAAGGRTPAGGGASATGGSNPGRASAPGLQPPIAPQPSPDRIAQAVRALLGARGVDVRGTVGDAVAALDPKALRQLRLDLETWFDGAMDRASGWYRRRTEAILLALGLLVAFGLNVNAVTIGQALAKDDVLRAAIVAQAEEAAARPDLVSEPADREEDGSDETAPDPAAEGGDADASGEATDDGVGDEAAGGVGAGASDEDEEVTSDAPAGDEATAETGADQTGEDATDDVTDEAATETPSERARVLYREALAVGLPIGWTEAAFVGLEREMPTADPWPDTWGDFRANLRVWAAWFLPLIPGYLVTAFAVTLGAPFWFDLLNLFVRVRSTVKPTEGSRDEVA